MQQKRRKRRNNGMQSILREREKFNPKCFCGGSAGSGSVFWTSQEVGLSKAWRLPNIGFGRGMLRRRTRI
jgi:hypothetical protein